MSGSSFHPFKGRISRHFRESLAPDVAYLSYYDVRLTKEDVDCVRNDWLTDNIIAFWEEYLEQEKLKAFPEANIVLLRPSMCFMLNQTPNPLTLKDALPSFAKTTHVFLPVNDCSSPNLAEGGSHWSLLLVSIIDGVAFHYDSLHSSNSEHAALATHRLSQLLGQSLRFVDLSDTPQQENGSDCGVFVCIQMKFLLLRRLLQSDAREKVGMSMGGMDVDAKKGRRTIERLIEDFRKEGRRASGSRSRSPFTSGKDRSGSPPRIGN